jgi:hypothetical protein
MTIIKRVAQALIDNGNGELADELASYHQRIMSLVSRLGELHQRKDEVVREFINVVQVNCQHELWHHTIHESEIACLACGHTINSDRAVGWGKRVLEKHHNWTYRHYYAGGLRFRLNQEMKTHLGLQLVVNPIQSTNNKAEAVAS